MKSFLYLAVGYCAAAVLIVLLSRENGVEPLLTGWANARMLAPIFGRLAGYLLLVGIVLAALTRVRSMRATVISIFLAFVATLFFQSGFSLIKTSMPYINPFFADPMLAQLDKALHGGVDPWIWAHDVAAYLPMDWITPFYLRVWAWPAICLPIFIAATDNNPERVKRTMISYVLAWVLIGNVLALGGMSVGPVFYDRLLDIDRFAALTATLAQTDMDGFAEIQEFLWTVYVEDGQGIGSGISAFPSVHVSVATVTMFYMIERAKILAPFGVGFVAIILFLSVYTGYHYALDGYFSILTMAAIWFWLRRRQSGDLPQMQGVPQPA